MNVRGVVVCVDFSEMLSRSIARWQAGCNRLIVVTSPRDERTLKMCRLFNVETHITDIFYANGARFNKGAALSEAILHKRWRDYAEWLLLFDADIMPPVNWRDQFFRQRRRHDTLYGAWRYKVPEDKTDFDRYFTPDPKTRMPQSWVIGFFCMFHNVDPHLPKADKPMFDLDWPHAGNYDTTFTRRWPREKQEILNAPPMYHFGEERRHWAGKGEYSRLRGEFLDHRGGWEDWERERMANPPVITEPGCASCVQHSEAQTV